MAVLISIDAITACIHGEIMVGCWGRSSGGLREETYRRAKCRRSLELLGVIFKGPYATIWNLVRATGSIDQLSNDWGDRRNSRSWIQLGGQTRHIPQRKAKWWRVFEFFGCDQSAATKSVDVFASAYHRQNSRRLQMEMIEVGGERTSTLCE